MNEELKNIFGAEVTYPTAVSIGVFDGIHLGHQHIIGSTVGYAKINGLMPVAILFDPLPAQFFGRLGPNERILLRHEQEQKLYEMGIEKVIFLPFSNEIANLTPLEFLSAMQPALHCRRITMGEDFCLGKDRAGTAEVLTELGKEFGYETEVIQKDIMDGDIISSTRIRSLLHNGKISEANRLLGYSFFFSGEIIHGAARGRKLGFPTVNVKIPEGKLTPPNGVYAVYNYIDGKRYASVTNIGVRPTFGLENLGVFVESYMLNASGNFYGEDSRLELIEMLRSEIRFKSADDLKNQISKDIEQAVHILDTSV